MSHPLEARWKATQVKLDAARFALQPKLNAAQVQDYISAIEHNEFELALDALESASEFDQLSASELELLALAAESMDLDTRATQLRKGQTPPNVA